MNICEDQEDDEDVIIIEDEGDSKSTVSGDHHHQGVAPTWNSTSPNCNRNHQSAENKNSHEHVQEINYCDYEDVSDGDFDNEIEVLRVNQTLTNGSCDSNDLKGLPEPPKTFDLTAIIAGDTVYGLEKGLKDPWREAIVEKVENNVRGVEVCKLKFVGEKTVGRKVIESKVVSGKHVAYFIPTALAIPEGFRVIARTLDTTNTGRMFFAGVIAESPTSVNNRYLIFFDDGQAAYCHPKDVRIVPRANSVPKNTWSEVHPDMQSFIKKYNKAYPLVSKATIRKGSVITVEWNGVWCSAHVVKTHFSLVKLKLLVNGLQIVVWRGSDRLLPNLLKKHESRINFDVGSLSALPIPVEYEGKVVPHQVGSKSSKKPDGHDCNQCCSDSFPGTDDERRNVKRNVSQLAYPLFCGWKRGIIDDAQAKPVYYDAPCGIRLWSLDAVQRFISKTNCSIGIDSFSYEIKLNCLAEFQTTATPWVICEDISNGKENIPVSKIDSVTENVPPYIEYADPKIRFPRDQTFINTRSEFMTCCDCTDNCQDKQNCACFRSTFENDPDFLTTTPAEFLKGYQHRRLFQKYFSGLYECNNNCKCRSTCINKVVQNGLQFKLQVFNTSAKGYAVRTLSDIPRGSFICVYNGEIMCSSKATLNGHRFGDEYLANLDFIEIAEKYKEGYEPIVVEPQFQSSAGRQCGQPPDIEVITLDDEDVDNEDAGTASLDGGESSSTRALFGQDEDKDIYAIDARAIGNVGRYINHSCNPNVFSQDVFFDTHDIRFPWVAFFASRFIKSGTELTWDYNYTVGMADGKFMACNCGAIGCRRRLL